MLPPGTPSIRNAPESLTVAARAVPTTRTRRPATDTPLDAMGVEATLGFPTANTPPPPPPAVTVPSITAPVPSLPDGDVGELPAHAAASHTPVQAATRRTGDRRRTDKNCL